MAISTPLDEPFFFGVASAEDTPYYLPVALGSHQYIIDLKKYRRQTIAPIRPPQDNSNEPGEQSLTQEGLWRRSQSSWHLGAGQEFFDDTDSVRQRFLSSQGLDPWTRRELKLLKATINRLVSANTNLKVLQVGTKLAYVNAAEVWTVADPSAAWTGGNAPVATLIATGGGSGNVQSITTNGSIIWAIMGTGQLKQTISPHTTSTQLAVGPYELVGYANGRLIAANNQKLYEIAMNGTALDLWSTGHPNTNFQWSVIASAPNAIYVAGTSVDRSEIYALVALDATGALAPPVLAAQLPDGETINALIYYGGGVLIGTSRGLRLAAIGSNNSLQYGPVILISGGVNSFEGQGEFVWFTWTNYNGTSTGLGRVNLSDFTAELVPAYASDLMAAAQGSVLSVCTVGTKRYFAVSAVGFFAEHPTDYVASGTIDTGFITYGTTEKKIATALDMRHEALPALASVAASMEIESGVATSVGTSETALSLSPATPLTIEVDETEAMKVQLTLEKGSRTITGGTTTSGSKLIGGIFNEGDVEALITGTGIPIGAKILDITGTTATLDVAATATGSPITFTLNTTPQVKRWTLFGLVTPVLNDEIILPIIMKTGVLSQLGEGQEIPYDPLTEYRHLRSLAQSKKIQRYQEGLESYNVYVSQVQIEPEDWTPDRDFFQGTLNVRLVTIGVI